MCRLSNTSLNESCHAAFSTRRVVVFESDWKNCFSESLEKLPSLGYTRFEEGSARPQQRSHQKDAQNPHSGATRERDLERLGPGAVPIFRRLLLSPNDDVREQVRTPSRDEDASWERETSQVMAVCRRYGLWATSRATRRRVATSRWAASSIYLE